MCKVTNDGSQSLKYTLQQRTYHTGIAYLCDVLRVTRRVFETFNTARKQVRREQNARELSPLNSNRAAFVYNRVPIIVRAEN